MTKHIVKLLMNIRNTKKINGDRRTRNASSLYTENVYVNRKIKIQYKN